MGQRFLRTAVTSTVYILIMLLLVSNTSALAAFAGGDGTSGNPYQIADVNQLQEMNDYLSSSFILINDIDAGTTGSWNSGAGFDPIGDYSTKFTGSFDGQGYKITGLYIYRPDENAVGLFGNADTDSEIFDVGVEADITGNNYVGGLVGTNSGTVASCYSTGSVKGSYYVGGLLGGKFGANTVTSCYSIADVKGFTCLGGLVGTNGSTTSTITSCFSTGSVNDAADVGGLVGKNYGTVSACYWNTETSGQATSAGGTGKTNGQMLQQATYSGWDFTTTWGIDEGVSYPFLQSLGNSHIHILVSSPTGPDTYEYGSTKDLNIRLGSKPAADVTIGFSSSDTTEGDVSVSSLTFTDSNWYLAQTVTVSGMDDGIADGDQAYSIIISPAVSSDTIYNGIDPGDIFLINRQAVLIHDINDLQDISLDLSGYYELAGNIDASATASWNSGAGFDPIGDYSNPFTGVFCGKGYKITGLYINRPDESFVGLFGSIDHAAAIIKDVGVEGNISGGSSVGGLVGWMIEGTVTSCYSTGTVSGNSGTGGLVGSSSGAIRSCYSTSNVSYSYTTSLYHSVGGLVGGNNPEGSISFCYSAGSVRGNRGEAGGLVGNNSGSVTSCYWNTDTACQTTSDGGTGKTNAEMVQQAAYPGWDFADTWSITEGVTYPFLQSLGNSHIYINAAPASYLKTDEYGLYTELFIRLGSKPSSDVTVDVTSSDTTEGTVSVAGLTFNDSNWYGQSITVTGLDDGIADGDQAYSIVFDPAASGDADYNGIDPDDLSLINYEPVPINDVNDLQNISLDLSRHYALAGNIDASDTINWNSGEGFDPIGAGSVSSFTGTLYGNGYEISGLYVNRPGEYYLGLFGNTRGDAVITDVGLEVDITGDSKYIASLVGQNYGTITNCYGRGQVNGGSSHTGGLVALNGYGELTNCYSTCSVSGGNYFTGGLVGENEGGKITNCYSTGSVTGGSFYVGGLVGGNDNGTVTDCYWDTETSGQSVSDGGTGKTTGQMQQQATFSGWNFIDIWSIYENNSYPFFAWDPDVDHDGISNTDETGVYGTLPYSADSDDDGLDDGDELIYWGADWDTDYDGDAATYANNLLDPDADNDGFNDGLEIDNGSDPGDAGSTPDIFVNLVDWNGSLVADFGNRGMWYYDGSSWNWMTNDGHVNRMVVWDGKLVVDFGVGKGLYYYDGSWHWMTNRSLPSNIAAWDNGTTEVLVVDFGSGRRIYTYDGSWDWFTNKDDVAGMTVWNDTLVVDFGSGRGVYNNDGTWHWLTNRDDIALMLPWDNGVTEVLVADFGCGRRMYTYDGAWNWLINKDDVNTMAVWDNKLVVDFGGGRNIYTYDGSWSWLNNKDDVTKMVAWNDGANDNLAFDFGPGRGLYSYDGSWTWLSNKDDVPEMIAWGNGLVVDFGPGDGVYRYNGAWNLIRSWSTAE